MHGNRDFLLNQASSMIYGYIDGDIYHRFNGFSNESKQNFIAGKFVCGEKHENSTFTSWKIR